MPPTVNPVGVSAPWLLSAPTPAPTATGSKNASCTVPAGAVTVTVKSSYVSSGMKLHGISE